MERNELESLGKTGFIKLSNLCMWTCCICFRIPSPKQKTIEFCSMPQAGDFEVVHGCAHAVFSTRRFPSDDSMASEKNRLSGYSAPVDRDRGGKSGFGKKEDYKTWVGPQWFPLYFPYFPYGSPRIPVQKGKG